MNELSTEAAARREKDAKRKRESRKRASLDKQVEGITSYTELWELNRAALPPQELAALTEQQERVFDLMTWITDNVNGTYITEEDELFVSMTEGTADVYVHIAQHGIVNIELILLDEYWLTPLYRERFQGQDAESIFARLGILVGIPSIRLHQFEEYLRRTATATATSSATSSYVTMTCACGRVDGTETTSIDIAEGYKKLGTPYLCYRCLDLEKKSRAQSLLYSK